MGQTREEFKEARRKGIGGTDWTHILNMKPYGCSRKLMYQKLGMAPDFPEEEHGYFERGRQLEPIVADFAAEFFNVTLRRPGKLPTKNAPDWWIGNPDRLVVPDGIWEGKTMNPIRFSRVKADGIPPDHIMQIQHYTKQTGREYGLYTVLEPVSWEFYHAQVHRDDDMLNLMEEQGARFWEMKEKTMLPEKLNAGDSRCRKCPYRLSCQGEALFLAVPESDPADLPVIGGTEILDLLEERDELSEVLAEAKSLRDDCDDKIKAILGKQGKFTTDLGRNIYWTSYFRTSLDSQKMKKELPDMWERFKKTTAVTTFRVY